MPKQLTREKVDTRRCLNTCASFRARRPEWQRASLHGRRLHWFAISASSTSVKLAATTKRQLFIEKSFNLTSSIITNSDDDCSRFTLRTITSSRWQARDRKSTRL